jgi:competence CoiA-like predicted nuclease
MNLCNNSKQVQSTYTQEQATIISEANWNYSKDYYDTENTRYYTITITQDINISYNNGENTTTLTETLGSFKQEYEPDMSSIIYSYNAMKYNTGDTIMIYYDKNNPSKVYKKDYVDSTTSFSWLGWILGVLIIFVVYSLVIGALIDRRSYTNNNNMFGGGMGGSF